MINTKSNTLLKYIKNNWNPLEYFSMKLNWDEAKILKKIVRGYRGVYLRNKK